MRKYLKRNLPEPETIRANRWLSPLAGTLLHPRLWHLNRHSASGAVAVGLFCGLIPGPFQMIGAALCCLLFRVNLPLALVTTLYANPFTIVPLYLAAFTIGKSVVDDGRVFTPPPEMGQMGLFSWLGALLDWTLGLGAPLAIGLIMLGGALALVGYFVVRLLWRWHSARAWQARQNARTGRHDD
jgi:uncharacterized protein (DUF2062 family)